MAMDVVVLGSGAMGSLFGGLLTEAGNDVTLVDIRADHVEAMDEDGLAISTPDGDGRTVEVNATTDATTVEGVDLAIVFVKSIHTESAVADAAPVLGDDVDVLTAQNGLGNAEVIAEAVPEERVIGGVTSQAAVLEGPGRVTHTGQGPTSIGRYFVDNDETVRRIAGQLTAAGIETAVTDAVRDAVWEKVLVNLGINAATALARVRNGLIAETEPGRDLVEAAVTEGRAVAGAEGRTVRSDIIEHALRIAEETAANKSSMRQDLEAGRATEIGTLNGEIVRRAGRHGLEAPANRTLTRLVRLAEEGFDE